MLCAEGAPEVVDSTQAHDEMLFIRYADFGCNLAFTELYETYSPVVFRHLHKFIPLSNQCEDLMQETFLMVSQSDDYQRGRSVKNWIISIADNLAMKAIRASGRLKRGGDSPHVQLSSLMEDNTDDSMEQLTDASLQEPVDEMAQDDAMQKVRDLLDTLGPEDRKVIEMAYFQDKTHREIALEMNFASKSTATRRINAILARMKDALLEADHVCLSA